MTFNKMTLSRMMCKLSTMPNRKTTMPPVEWDANAWHSHFPFLLSVKFTHHSAECHFVESHAAKCPFAEYQSAANTNDD